MKAIYQFDGELKRPVGVPLVLVHPFYFDEKENRGSYYLPFEFKGVTKNHLVWDCLGAWEVYKRNLNQLLSDSREREVFVLES